MASVFDSIGDLNAVIDPLVNTNTLDGSLATDAFPALDTCLLELAVSLGTARNAGLSDSETKKFVIDALVTPFNEAAQALSETFIPDPQAFDGEEGFSGLVSEYTKQVVESIKNPIAAILAQQRAVFQTSLTEVGDLIRGGADSNDSITGEVYDRVHFLLTELFLDGQDAGNNLGGLLLFAVEESLPAIDLELRYLKRMRAAIRTTVEETSRLPPSMVPQLPSLYTATRLCNAEEHLDRVARDLRNNQTWNRSEFAQATEAVCVSKDTMISGIIPPDGRELVKTITGWDDRQLNSIQNLSFMPNVKFRLSTIELVALNNFVQEQDVSVIEFHSNLRNALDVLESLTTLHIGDVLALIVEVLRNQIASLRLDLEAQAEGFTGALPRGIPDSIETPDQTIQVISNPTPGLSQEGLLRRNVKYATDVYASLSSQVAAYTVLSGLCFVMERTQRMYTGIQSLLSANSRFYKLLLSFTNYYRAADCGDSGGAATINSRLQGFLDAAEARLRGDDRSSSVLATRAQDLEQAIRNHERFLVCSRERLFFGRQDILETAVGITNAVRAAKNIMNLVRKVPDLYDAIRTLDFKKMLGLEATEYNALDAIMRSLQCLVLQCDNQFVSSVARVAQREFQSSFDQRKARAITIGSLDELPRASRVSGLNSRVTAFFRVIQSLQRLTSVSIEDLCNIDTSGRPTADQVLAGNAAPSTVEPLQGETSLTGAPVDEAARALLEQEQRDTAADQARPFGSRIG